MDSTLDFCRRCQRHKVNAALNPAEGATKGLARDTMLWLMNVVQIYDLEHGCVVGEEQMFSRFSSRLCVQLRVHGLGEVHESRSSVPREL